MPHSKPIRARVRSAANTSPIIKQDKAMEGNWLSQEDLQPETSRSSCVPWTRCLFISLLSNTLCVDVSVQLLKSGLVSSRRAALMVREKDYGYSVQRLHTTGLRKTKSLQTHSHS